MPQAQSKKNEIIHLIWSNALRFFFSVGFATLFQLLFGAENILVGVAICVGWTMFPETYTGVNLGATVAIQLSLYLGGVAAAQAALLSPWAAFPIYLVFLLAVLLLSNEPMPYKPSISFLLCFIFSQAMPVPMARFPLRLLGAFCGALVVAGTTVLYWKRAGHGQGGRTIRQQAALCRKNRSYNLRMAIGVSLAMSAGMLFHLPKPLWLSIVVMSLTQLEFRETLERIKYRTLATLVGGGLFVVVFGLLVPAKYAILVILLLGYISFFTPEYKYKQVVNAICAINASLIFLDTTQAITNRLACLLGGIAIVLLLWIIQHPAKRLHSRLAANTQ